LFRTPIINQPPFRDPGYRTVRQADPWWSRIPALGEVIAVRSMVCLALT